MAKGPVFRALALGAGLALGVAVGAAPAGAAPTQRTITQGTEAA